VCERAPSCPTRLVWQEAAKAMFDKLNTITLADLLPQNQEAVGAARESRHVF
jgi:DNA-binding IscR family transcriptional regulator